MSGLADYLSRLPWQVAALIVVLGLMAALTVTLICLLWATSVSDSRHRNHVKLHGQPWLSHEDDGGVYEIPMYPVPPMHITRWGMHRSHVLRGLETEKGCPVCVQLGLHLKQDIYSRVRMQGKRAGPETGQ